MKPQNQIETKRKKKREYMQRFRDTHPEYKERQKILKHEWYKQNKARYSKYREAHPINKEENKEYMKKYRLKNKERIQKVTKEYRQNHPEKIKELRKKWYVLRDKEKKKESAAKDYQKHKNERVEKHKEYLKTPSGRLALYKIIARRRRELGYEPLNKIFPQSHGHHLDKKNVIFMPNELHKTVRHKQKDEESMKNINILAWDYLEASVL